MDPLREFPQRLQATEVGWEGCAGETGWSRSPRGEKGGVLAGRRTSGNFLFPDAEGKGSCDKESQCGWVEAEDENGKLAGSTRRPRLLPVLNFTVGGRAGRLTSNDRYP